MEERRLRVTEEILERVVYGMENQKDTLMLDPGEGVLRHAAGNTGDLIPLPPWGPSEGYRLMDRFVMGLPETPLRGRLADALHSGSGVFRRFKNELGDRPEFLELWRRFKFQQMRRTALSWLSRWGESLELESLGPEPEEWDDLPMADFFIRPSEAADMPVINAWEYEAVKEAGVPAEMSQGWFATVGGRDEPLPEDGIVLAAENPAGEIVGFAWAAVRDNRGDSEGRLMRVYVVPECRGAGIGRALAERILAAVREAGAVRLSAATGCGDSILTGLLEQNGFRRAAVEWRLGG